MKSRSTFTIKARSYVLKFGQYKGETIQSILDDDPSYLLWLHFEKGIVKLSQDIVDDAQKESERRDGHSRNHNWSYYYDDEPSWLMGMEEPF